MLHLLNKYEDGYNRTYVELKLTGYMKVGNNEQL